MNVSDAIDRRRAYRSLEPIEVTSELVEDLASAAHLAPSCFNNQPWRFVFVHDKVQLGRMHEALTRGNAWAKDASMMIVVLTRPDLDCHPKGRAYDMFDTGLAVGFLILRATELGLVAHPTAGFSAAKTREILGIPEEYTIVTIVHVGGLAMGSTQPLEEWQREREIGPRVRRPLSTVLHHDRYRPENEPPDLDDKGSASGWARTEWIDPPSGWSRRGLGR